LILGPAKAGNNVADGVALGPRALPAGMGRQELSQVMALGLSKELVAELPGEHRQVFLRTLQTGKCEITRLRADSQEVEVSTNNLSDTVHASLRCNRGRGRMPMTCGADRSRLTTGSPS